MYNIPTIKLCRIAQCTIPVWNTLRVPDAVPGSRLPRHRSETLLRWVYSLFVQLSLHNIISPVYEVEVYEVWCDSSLKNEFSRKNLNTFWLRVQAECPILWELAMATLLPFVTTSICENLHFQHWRRLKRNTAQVLKEYRVFHETRID